MAMILTKQLMQLKEEAIRPGQNKFAQLNVGSIVTSIFLECKIPLPVFDEPPQFIDEIALSSSWFLGGMVNEKYVYHFHLEKDNKKKILLPNQALMDMTKWKNVVFIPPRAELFTKGPVPTPFWKVKKDKAEGKDRAEPSTAADEHSSAEDKTVYGAERYRFSPFHEPVASRPLQEAHRHIGLL